MKTKIKLFKIFTTFFIIMILIFSLSLHIFASRADTNLKQIKETIETESQKNIKTDLESMKSDFEIAISNNEIDMNNDEQITDWVLNHLSIKNKDYLKNFDLVNLGYSLNDNNVIDYSILDNYDLPEDAKSYIKEVCKKELVLIDKTNEEIENEIIKISNKIVYKYNFGREDAVRIITDMVFQKGKLLFSTNNNELPLSLDELISIKDYTFVNNGGDNVWVESISIPSGTLGFDNQPIYKNNIENLSYKKILFIVTIDSNIVMNPYNNYLKSYNYIKWILITITCILLFMVLLFSMKQFYEILIKYNEGGDTNAKDLRINNFIFNKLLRIDDIGIK